MVKGLIRFYKKWMFGKAQKLARESTGQVELVKHSLTINAGEQPRRCTEAKRRGPSSEVRSEKGAQAAGGAAAAKREIAGGKEGNNENGDLQPPRRERRLDRVWGERRKCYNGARAPSPLCNGPAERPMAKRGTASGGGAAFFLGWRVESWAGIWYNIGHEQFYKRK